uniref:Uncharacterized protein n=1 Tax=Anopheles culicifacies TaxID=139723 RepID=A0A182LRD6_9DIPT
LIPVLSKVVVKYNIKLINVTRTINNIQTITNQTVTFEMEMFRELKEMKATFSYYVVGLDSNSLNHLITRTVDVCAFLKRPSMDRFVKNVYDQMQRNNRIPTKCPIPPGAYYIRNVSPTSVRLPGFFPESGFVFDNNYYSGLRSEPMVECRFHGKLVRVTDDMLHSSKLILTYYAVTLNKLVQTVLVKRSLNLCFFIRNPQSDRLVNTIYNYVKERSNFPLLPYCTEIDFKSKVKNIVVSTTYYRRESVTHQSFDFDVNITSPLYFSYYSIVGNGTVRNALVKRAVDLCFYMQNPNSDRLLKVVYDYVRQRTNLPKRCPVPAASYHIRNVRPADVPVPTFIPEAEFIMELIYRNELTAAYYVVTGESKNRILQRMVDLCAYVKRPSTDRFIRVFYDHMLPNNRFVTGCPIPPKETFYVRNLYPSAIRVPGFLPESNFIFETSYQTGVLMETFINNVMRPFISFKEVKVNGKFVNVSIVDVGAYEFNVTHLMQIQAKHLIRDVKIFISYFVRAFDGAVQKELISRWVDGCEFIRRPGSDRLVKMYYDIIKKYSKIPRCPFDVGDEMVLNFTPSCFPVPGILPQTDFLIEVRAYTNALTKHHISPITNPNCAQSDYDSSIDHAMRASPILIVLCTHLTLAFGGKSEKLQASYYVRSGMLENLLYDSRLDLCAFFVRPNERLVKMVFDNLKRHGVMPKGCPVHPGDSMILTNVTLNYINLPVYLPETSFKLVVKCWQGPEKTLIFDSRWNGRLKKLIVKN